MEISWLGGSEVLLRGRDSRVVLTQAAFAGRTANEAPGSAELVVSCGGGENALRPASGPQVVARPGEYELHGVSVRGLSSKGGVAFVTQVDEVSVLCLSESLDQLGDDTVDDLGSVDVLLVSLHGAAAVAAQRAAALAAKIQPSVVIPIGYDPAGEAESGLAFTREMGTSDVAAQAKLTLTGSSGPSEETRVVLLEPRR